MSNKRELFGNECREIRWFQVREALESQGRGCNIQWNLPREATMESGIWGK